MIFVLKVLFCNSYKYTACFLSLQAVVWQDWRTKWLFQCNDLTLIFPSLFPTSRATSFSLYTLRSYCLSLNTSLFCHHHRRVHWIILGQFHILFNCPSHSTDAFILFTHPIGYTYTRIHSVPFSMHAKLFWTHSTQNIGAGGFHQQLSLQPSLYC